ncbi:hypothetical protein RD110_05985 [Rhodoferax koreense]|uniref:PLD phosphodiesterase domain-containing protein n=1 Tax=Rhodoferax koreensis TaxID=1842727 RepID=A0A1P8JST9_9BURK|nr:phospholipase D-like domain-containing protein [Rhodoferax koreense]APW36798.1 hypothetical protein RD110_05985 [Rhodoferax koreense]
MPSPTDTQQTCTVPLSDLSRRATGAAQWRLEKKEDAQTPVFHYNNLSVYICGEESFRQIADDIKKAERSIDIVCWGFDPAMELTRTAGRWKRGDTWGDLLRSAARGELARKQKVRVRVLCWYDSLGAALGGSNMPGYRTDASYELKAAPGRGMAAALVPYGKLPPLPEPADPKDQREMFNSHWYRDVVAGKMEGVSLRTRGGVHADVLASLKAEIARTRGATVGGIERAGLEWMATHHQKTIVIDYEGADPRAYVMGLNSVTDYWDTQAHRYNDPLRGENFEGSDKDHSVGMGWEPGSSGAPTLKPYQDYACRIEGDAIVAVYRNFVEAWNKAEAKGPGAGAPASGEIDLKAPPPRLFKNLKSRCSGAQILRTLPDSEGGERSIARLYYQTSSFARHYLYIENQYFQNTDWARALKDARQAFVQGCSSASPPIPLSRIPVLHVIVVTPTPERGQMVPRTHDTVAELGHGDSMPNQDEEIRKALARRDQSQKDMAEYKKRRAAHDARGTDTALYTPYAAMEPPPSPPQPLSDIAQSYVDAGGARDSQKTRDLLSQTLGMRTLVASLWTYDAEWREDQLPIAKRIDEEKPLHARQQKEWDDDQAAKKQASARTVEAGGWRVYTDTRMPPTPPVDRSQQLKNAKALRYREIYIHSKLMIIDDSMFTLGSANLNLRSFAADSEMNIASDDRYKAQDLRRRVWKQHTNKQFDGGADATDQAAMKRTFNNWEREASNNLTNKRNGLSLTSFLVKFLDERTSVIRLG